MRKGNPSSCQNQAVCIIICVFKEKNENADFWQDVVLTLPANNKTMNRIPLDELYLLYSLYGFRELSTDEQGRFTITKFEYTPYPELFMAKVQLEYENENGVKTKLLFELAGKRSEDYYYEHVMYEDNGEEIEFSSFRKAVDFCNMKGDTNK